MMSLSALVLWIAAASELQVSTSGESQQTVPAKIVSTAAPIFPASEHGKGNEAWVHITYCVDESGAPQNVTVLDSVGAAAFEQAAVQSVEQWTFEPALVNGKPVWQSRTKTTISFTINDEDGQGKNRRVKSFSSNFRKLGRLIDNNQLQKADELFWEIYATTPLSLYDHATLWAKRALYEVAAGELTNMDVALHRATISKGKWLDKDDYVELLKLRVNVELRIGQYGDAIATYDELKKAAGENSDVVTDLRSIFELIQEKIDSNSALSIQGEVKARGGCNNCNNSWAFTPLRNRFAFSNVNGKLASIELRCDHKRFESIVSDEVEWRIPDAWGKCDAQVYGEPGTTFELLLLPD